MKRIHTHAHWLGKLALSGLLAACSTTGPALELSVSPENLEEGQNVTLKASLASTMNPVAKVEFYLVQSTPVQSTQVQSTQAQSAMMRGRLAQSNTEVMNKVGEDSTEPYEVSFPLHINQPGEVGFVARAIGPDDQVLSSKSVKASVSADSQPPSINLAASSTHLNAAATITLMAQASDNLGVVKVEFFRGNNKLGQDTIPADGFSLNVSLSAEDMGTAKYSAKAYDARGNSSGSGEVSVVVDMDVVPPSISLASSKASLYQPGFFSLVATASDNEEIARVEFFNGTAKVGERTIAPYVWQMGYIGNHDALEQYSAKAYDAAGNTATSNSIEVDVDIDISSPSVSLTSSLTTVTSPGQITLLAAASDNRGVVKVEFYDGTNKIGEDISPGDGFSLAVSLALADNGLHSYTAKAFDAAGNSKVSEVVEVTVSIP